MRKDADLMISFNKNKVAYESLSLASGILIREVLVAGALQGAVFGLVKAAMGRMAAKGYRRFIRNDPEH